MSSHKALAAATLRVPRVSLPIFPLSLPQSSPGCIPNQHPDQLRSRSVATCCSRHGSPSLTSSPPSTTPGESNGSKDTTLEPPSRFDWRSRARRGLAAQAILTGGPSTSSSHASGANGRSYTRQRKYRQREAHPHVELQLGEPYHTEVVSYEDRYALSLPMMFRRDTPNNPLCATASCL